MSIRVKTFIATALLGTFAFASSAFAGTPAQQRRERVAEHNREVREHNREVREHSREKVEHRREEREKARESMFRREEAFLERQRMERYRDYRAWEAARAERARAHRQMTYGLWGFALYTPEGRAELALHENRMARLHRLREIEMQRRDTIKIGVIDKLIEIENGRITVVLLEIKKRSHF